MPIDKSRLREHFRNREKLEFEPLTPEVIEEFQRKMKELHDSQEESARHQREFTTTCRCHTGGICYFHTEFM